jgi:UDP-2-acetamido-2,6-beta-L-arabino-hexul-4-ose reductase
MTRVLITGGRGFLGRNLMAHLSAQTNCQVTVFETENSEEELQRWLLEADIVFHLAGINRPKNISEFEEGNAALTARICQILEEGERCPAIIFSSSIWASADNAYGLSKKKAEDTLRQFAMTTGARVRIYRLNNLFGKWCRPNYNSVVATFCHNIAHDLPIVISDSNREIELSYVDDVMASFISEINEKPECEPGLEIPSYRIELGELARKLQAFRDMKTTLTVPDLADRFDRALYATYLSYVPAEALQQQLEIRSDARGTLAEFIKSQHFGQIFISRTKPGVTRGNHYHHTKAEKFLVLEGEALIRIRATEGEAIHDYSVSGKEYRVVDIPPGTTHSISNVGNTELVTLFWSDEVFDQISPDTYPLPVENGSQNRSMQSRDL